MTVIKCKGTKLQQDIASTLTDIAQILSLDGPDSEVETFEADYLGNTDAGIPMMETGRVSGGTVSFEIFLDPGLASHTALLSKIKTPDSKPWAIVFANAIVDPETAATTWPFDGILKSLSPAVDLADGLKASGEIELDGMVTYP